MPSAHAHQSVATQPPMQAVHALTAAHGAAGLR